ncbi:cellulose binding domain-containing protein [Synechococcus sp. ROS8604]|uniref:cellulose binding domain-containing protein n=1 Tax=Synechococcus sp. ROS8604 TaxID=1442557 RepID=UPI001647778A|nr:cellulose binding domain-containing protein [Synechococcus sp. ROS8604]QNI90150.1 carbohydrate-binding module family 2-containing protein [Synechococcus sp. ROS8604]
MPSTHSLRASISGDRWWGGFTAEITLTNTSTQDLSSWSYSFDSPHLINTAPWGAEISAVLLDNGLTRYTLTGKDWGEKIPAGESITIGFNGTQGTDLGNEGELSAAMLFGSDSAEAVISQVSEVSSESSATTTNPGLEPVLETPPMTSPMESTMASPMSEHGMGDHEMPHGSSSGDYIDISTWGSFHGSNHNSEHNELVGGRTAITTEAMVAYNGLRAFAGLDVVEIEAVGEWAFAQGLTNNSQAWGDDTKGVGLWFAMQGAKVGWIADASYDPQILADIQRTARLGSSGDVMQMVEQFGHEGFATYLTTNQLEEHFINTLKMEPHYGGWMHARTHGFLSIEGVAIAHDIHHLTVLGWDQNEPFMNDTFDWPQWPALDVSDNTVINYYQGIVELGDPLSENLNNLSGTTPLIVSTDSNSSLNPSPSDPGTVQPDPLTGSPLEIQVSGDLWEGGFTASLNVTNQSNQSTDDWGVSFISTHQFYGESWGVDVSTQELGDGLYRYELTGADWAQSLAAGQSMTVGFNALSGEDLSGDSSLTSELLMAPGTELALL